MRIERAGTLLWTPADGVVLNGWTINMEGAPQPEEREVLALILNHIAMVSGVRAADPEQAAREAEDAIKRAREAGL